MTTPGEYDWNSMDARLTDRQRADFSALVDSWLQGQVPLGEAAAAMRAQIEALPPKRANSPTKRGEKPAPRKRAVKPPVDPSPAVDA
jgi:hypothetical protein